jgi:hypothetical protein
MTDTVLQPKHYMQGSHECIEEIEAMLTPDEFRGFLKGNVIKYRYRANLKNGKEDLAKADNYAYYLINGHFKTENDKKDEIAFNKLNDLMQDECIALAVCTLFKEKLLSPDTLRTKQKIYSLIDLNKTHELGSDSDSVFILYELHFTDDSKIEFLLERGVTLKNFFTTNCNCCTGARYRL